MEAERPLRADQIMKCGAHIDKVSNAHGVNLTVITLKHQVCEESH